MTQNPGCPACGANCSLLDAVDFNKSCEEIRGKFLESSGIPVHYALCEQCGFCFAPELFTWDMEEFESKIYNDEYILVDPDYLEIRPRASANTIISMFKDQAHLIKHLDYGGGNGLLSQYLKESGFNSSSYDPFVDRTVDINQLGKFDLITAFEVFEHVPDIQQLMSNLNTLLAPDGLILFSTLLSDGNIHANQKLTWWYASPRNGHISLFSEHSLTITAHGNGFNLGCFSTGFHVMFKTVPAWARHIIQTG